MSTFAHKVLPNTSKLEVDKEDPNEQMKRAKLREQSWPLGFEHKSKQITIEINQAASGARD